MTTPYLVKKAEIDAMPGTEKTHFLNPNGRRNNKSLGDVTGLTGFGFHIISIPPGADSTEYHRHYYEDEACYILEGTGIVVIDGTEYDIGPGDFIGYRKGGAAHKTVNTGDKNLKLIVVGERLPHDVADYPDKQKRIFRHQDMPWNLVDLDAIETPQAGKK